MHIHTFISPLSPGERERRVLYATLSEGSQGDDVAYLETAEKTGGRPENQDPLGKLESNASQNWKKIERIKVGWGSWINNFLRSGKAIESRIFNTLLTQAELKLKNDPEATAQLATGAIRRILKWGQWLAWRNKIALQMWEDMQKHNESQENAEFNRLMGVLESGAPISGKRAKEQKRLREAFEGAGARIKHMVENDERKGRIATAEIAEYQETKDLLTQELPRLGVVTPQQVDEKNPENLIDKLIRGDKTLINIVRRTDKIKDEGLRSRVLEKLKEIKPGFWGNATLEATSLLRLTESEDKNIGTLDERLQRLATDPRAPYRWHVKLNTGGGNAIDTRVIRQDQSDGLVLLQETAAPDRFRVLNTRERRHIFREGGGKPRRISLYDASFSIN